MFRCVEVQAPYDGCRVVRYDRLLRVRPSEHINYGEVFSYVCRQ